MEDEWQDLYAVPGFYCNSRQSALLGDCCALLAKQLANPRSFPVDWDVLCTQSCMARTGQHHEA